MREASPRIVVRSEGLVRVAILSAFFTASALLGSGPGPSTSEIAEMLRAQATALEGALSKLEAPRLLAADDGCDASPSSTSLASAVEDCRAQIARAWRDEAQKSVASLLAGQRREILGLEAKDATVVAKLEAASEARSRDVLQGLEEAAKKAAKELAAPTAGSLTSWLQTSSISKLPGTLASSAKAASEKYIEKILEIALSERDSRQQLLDQLEKAQKELIDTAAENFARSITCDWIPEAGGTRLSCGSKGLLLSGEEVSDIHVRGLPRGGEVEVRVLIAEQRPVGGESRRTRGELADRSVELADERITGNRKLREENARLRLDQDRLVYGPVDTLPVIVEVHTHRSFSPTHGGGTRILGLGRRDYWNRVVARLRGSERLAVVSKGQASRLFLAVRVGDEERVDTAEIPLGYARWKFEAGGFLSFSEAVDQEIETTAVDGSNPGRVRVESVRDADNYAVDTGALVNFVPQNYQAIGVALGFAANENEFPSTFLGLNFRVRTFGQRGLASLGAGLLVKSVQRFPGLEVGNQYPADSKLLSGRHEFEVEGAILFHLGFSFGPIGSAKGGGA